MISFTSATGGTRRATAAAAARCADSPQTTPIRPPQRHDKTSFIYSFRGKSGPALGGTEYRLFLNNLNNFIIRRFTTKPRDDRSDLSSGQASKPCSEIGIHFIHQAGSSNINNDNNVRKLNYKHLRRAASFASCFAQKWTLSVKNWLSASVKCRPEVLAVHYAKHPHLSS